MTAPVAGGRPQTVAAAARPGELRAHLATLATPDQLVAAATAADEVGATALAQLLRGAAG